MIDEAARAEMRRLVLGEGWRIGTVARRFSVHHSVVRRVIRDTPAEVARAITPSAVDAYKPYILARLEKYPELTATRLVAELREQGYDKGVAIVRRYVAHIRGPREKKAYLSIQPTLGEQAQVDWGSFGWMRIGSTQRPVSCFAIVLSWSRALFLDFSLDQRIETFCAMHRRAFEFFGGIPRKILYDNLKTVVLHHVGTTIQFNPTFLGFAGQYLFEPTAAPPRYPQAKGRVEGAIRYIRHGFFYGRSFDNLADLRAKAATFRDETANKRLHAATRERPADRLLVERTRLRPLPERPPHVELVLPAIVSKEAHVRLDTNTYSVPPNLVGQSVLVRADEQTVRVVANGVEVARHTRSWDRRCAVEDPAHREKLLARRPGAQAPRRRDAIANLAPEARVYLQEIARRRIRLDNEVAKLSRMLVQYGPTDLLEGIRRALTHRTFGAHYVRACIDQARFARGLGEPPEPVVTGHPTADRLDVEPHNLETYDDLFKHTKHTAPAPQVPPTGAAPQLSPSDAPESAPPRDPGEPNDD